VDVIFHSLHLKRLMKRELEEHIKMQGKSENTVEENTENELKRLALGKNAIISETILPILMKLGSGELPELVFFSNPKIKDEK